MRKPAFALAAAAFLFAACPPAEDPAAVEPTPVPTPTVMAACVNDQDGYRIDYPGDWYTNDEEVMPPCSVFHPEQFQLEPATELPIDLAIHARVEEVDFAAMSDPDERFERVIERTETEIDGRTAVRIETEATGEGLFDAGTLSYRYLVDLDGSTFVLATHDAGEPSYEEKKDLVDEMADTVDFTDA